MSRNLLPKPVTSEPYSTASSLQDNIELNTNLLSCLLEKESNEMLEDRLSLDATHLGCWHYYSINQLRDC